MSLRNTLYIQSIKRWRTMIMSDAISAIGNSEKSESIVDKFKKFQKMALGGDVKFSLPPVFGYGFPDGPKVSDGAKSASTASFKSQL